MLHLLLNKEDGELIVVTEESFASVFSTDHCFVEIEYTTQLQANSIPLRKVCDAFETFFNTQGYQQRLSIDVDFTPDELEVITKSITKAINRERG